MTPDMATQIKQCLDKLALGHTAASLIAMGYARAAVDAAVIKMADK